MKFICHVTLPKRMLKGICNIAFRHATPNHRPSSKFDSHGSRENEFVTSFVCYITLCDHEINRLYVFVDYKPALKPTILSSLEAIDLSEVEI